MNRLRPAVCLSIVVALHLTVLLDGDRAKCAEPLATLGPIGMLPAGVAEMQRQADEAELVWLKPGHWTATLCPAEVQQQDLLGHLRLSVTDGHGRAQRLPATPYRLVVERPAALARGESKRLRSVLFVPDRQGGLHGRAELNGGAGERVLAERMTPLGLMPSYQYQMVVLARRPRLYAYIDRLPSVRPSSDELSDSLTGPDYRVSLLDPSRPASLPTEAGRWTSIAHVIWDDWPVDRLSTSQRQAMLDWLHFGGRLIVSGPGSLDTLSGSFLDPFLPARRVGSREFGADELAVLADWRDVDDPARPSASRPIPGLALKLVDLRRARFLPGLGELFAEQRVGRGRVIVSALPLSDPRLTRWDGWDDVFNACLLGRPPRRFAVDELEGMTVRWADAKRFPETRDARLNTSLRYFARDAGLTFRDYAADVLAARRRLERGRATRHGTIVDPDARPRHAATRTRTGGLAAWRDRGPVADAARRELRDATGVSVPSRGFVVAAMVGYLVVLVPVNWLVFRSIGRPAWAWGAAPVIALAAAAVMVPAAGLNVGFVRARSEIALIEFQPDWPRAHVTRYTSLYTSLVTPYTVHFGSPGGVALPMANAAGLHLGATGILPVPDQSATGILPVRGPHPGPLPEGEGTVSVCYSPGDRPTLSGIVVASNTTGLVHAEETLDFSGPIELIDRPGGSELIRNRSGLKLRHVTVIAKQRNGRIVTARGPAAAKLIAAIDVRPIYELAIDPTTLEPGEVRLVAISDTPPPGMAIRPEASQSKSVAVVVAHLRSAHGPKPKGDVNAYKASGY